MLVPVIMAGGSGSRLWPLSRENFPKQFIPIASNWSLLQDTLLRVEGVSSTPPIVLCNEDHRFIAAEQLRELSIDKSTIILEPVKRDTAPAIAVATISALQQFKDEDLMLLVMPSDQFIDDENAFVASIEKAIEAAKNDKIVTFGIRPSSPETGYGYIKVQSDDEGVYTVESFKEKPCLEVAKQYLRSGSYYWNSGMFLFKADVLMKILSDVQPDILDCCKQSVQDQKKDLDFIRIDKQSFSKNRSISFDYAVMEKIDNASMVSLDAGWSDVGSWSAIWDVSNKDQNGNVVSGDVWTNNTYDSLIYSNDRLVTCIGLSNVIVVETKDAVLICEKEQVQTVKKLVTELNTDGREEVKDNRKSFRVWGTMNSIDSGVRDQVKRMTIKVGEKVSSQIHHHRAEHWIVVAGTARVTISGQTQLLTENESTFIPIGVEHSIENPGRVPLELIEVRTGNYIGEDDIVRFESR